MATPKKNPTFPEKYMIEFATIVASLQEYSPGVAIYVENKLTQIFRQADRSFDTQKFQYLIRKIDLNTKYNMPH